MEWDHVTCVHVTKRDGSYLPTFKPPPGTHVWYNTSFLSCEKSVLSALGYNILQRQLVRVIQSKNTSTVVYHFLFVFTLF
jgi:hypothetical protein